MKKNAEHLKNLILTGNFSLFYKEYLNLMSIENNRLVLNSTYDEVAYDENICGYGIACYLNLLEESVAQHNTIIGILEIYMPYMIGACKSSFSHVMRLTEIIPSSLSPYNAILRINITPEGSLPEGEIYEFAQEILSKWPDHVIANQIISSRRFTPHSKLSVAEKITHAIAIDKKAAFKDLILRGRYIETRQILPMLTDDEIEQLIFEIAEQEHNLCSYDYVWFWMRECGETAQRHSFLAKVTSESFKYDQKTFWEDLPGTKELIFFHTYRAAELEPENIELQEKLLSLYELGNESFDVKETKKLAERVLAAKPESAEALRVLKFLG